MTDRRPAGRAADELRPVTIEPGFVRTATGSALIACGGTRVICTASIEDGVPRWRKGSGLGWLTAEYGMLPASTGERKARDISRGRQDGRTVEIQRLIGRSLRGVVDLQALGERTVYIDCDVLEADGGTRTASINGAFIAVIDALTSLKGKIAPINEIVRDSVAAISVGLLNDVELLDLEYVEDRDAEVDMNLVMTGSGQFIEVQGTGEEATFSRSQLDRLLKLGKVGIDQITAQQKKALGASWPPG